MNDTIPEALMVRYVQSIPEKISEIERLTALQYRQVVRDKTSADCLALRNYIHKLAGSGGAYGFSDITNTARASLKVLDQDQYELTELQAKINDLILALQHVLAV